MVALKKEKELLFDEELKKVLKRVGNGEIEDYLECARALNLRAMPNLAFQIASDAISKFKINLFIFKEYILSISLFDDKLKKAKFLLKNFEEDEKIKAKSLLEYYLDEENWLPDDFVEKVKNKDALFYELLGHKAMENLNYKEAYKNYRKAFEKEPDPRYKLYQCEALLALGENEDSYELLIEVLNKNPYFVNAWNTLAQIYLEEDKLHLGYQAIGKALSINPNDWGAFFTLADYYFKKKQYGRARGVLEILLSLEPVKEISAEVLNYLGYLFTIEGRFIEAQKSLEKSLELNPHLAEAWFNMGNIFFHTKNFEEALKCYEMAAVSNEKMAQAYSQIGLCLLETNKIHNADKPLLKAISLDPTEYIAMLGLSEYYRRMKDKNRCLEYALKALQIEKDDPNVYNILGIAYEFNERFEEAENSYKKALEIEPMHRWAANNLGYLYEKMMEKDKKYKELAIEAWKKRLEICLKTNSSIRGSINHLLKLGVSKEEIKKYIDKIRK